jgi:putative two-component system response regulator
MKNSRNGLAKMERTMDETPKKSTIMIVDDNPVNLQLLQRLLDGCGYRVVAFPSGDLALNAAGRNHPDLILLDINMPKMNGYEVCGHLKADEKLKEIPVIFISALNEALDKVRAFSVGCVDYVTKPFQPEEVQARVQTHLRLRSMQLTLEFHNLHLEELVREKVQEISDSQMATILALANLAENRDDDTGKHVSRTQEFCKALAGKLRCHHRYAQSIDEAFLENIYFAASLHDIGKVGIPDRILLKPGKLTPAEFEIMKTHAVIGARTLQASNLKYPRNAFLNMGIAIARSHHEKWDGSGYPDGLGGDDIPLCARIMALADVYDALRSERPYKDAYTHEKSCGIIMEGTGRHFDTVVVEAFTAIQNDFLEVWKKNEGR